MSGVLYSLGRWCATHRVRVLLIWVLLISAVGSFSLIFGKEFRNEFTLPAAESQQALAQLSMTFPEVTGTSATEIIVVPKGHKVSDPAIKKIIEKNVKDLKKLSMVAEVVSPWNKNVTGLINGTQRAARIILTLKSKTVPDLSELQPLTDVAKEAQSKLPANSLAIMGGQAFNVEIPRISFTEAIGVLVAVVVLAFVLGSLVAAGLPLITALSSVAVTMAVMFAFTSITTVNTTTPLLSLMLGIAVGIDYALFVLSRHRDQLRQKIDVKESIARAVATSGSAVVFAGLTVIIALVGLAITRIPFLAAMGFFAAFAVFGAIAVSLTLLPALASFLGERMRPKTTSNNKISKFKKTKQQENVKNITKGLGYRWASLVTKFPILTIVIVISGLVLLALPARNLQFSLPNSGEHTIGKPDREAFDETAKQFGPGFNATLLVTVDIIQSKDPLGLIADLKKDISQMSRVESVVMATPNRNADIGVIQVIPKTGPSNPETAQLVKDLRAKKPIWKQKYDVNTSVTGYDAVVIDISEKLAESLLPFGIFVVGLSCVLLTMVFRSIAIPIKASIGYLLSVASAFGATNLVFNQGHLGKLINLERGMPIISFLPICLMGILFGLAMDYEVFLVSRIREEYVHGKSATEAIRTGMALSGKVVTGAALIMVSVFAFFVPHGDGPIKSIAFSLTIGVGVDAFLIRITLVPAVLQLLGDKAWWMPKWLDKRMPTLDIEGAAIANEIKLQDWPNSPAVIYADKLQVKGIFNDFSCVAMFGQTWAFVGSAQRRQAAILALSGRLMIDGGKARIAGSLLPYNMRKVRKNTGYLRVIHALDVAADLKKIERRDPKIYLIDSADLVWRSADKIALNELIAKAKQTAQFVVILGFSNQTTVCEYDISNVLNLDDDLAVSGGGNDIDSFKKTLEISDVPISTTTSVGSSGDGRDN